MKNVRTISRSPLKQYTKVSIRALAYIVSENNSVLMVQQANDKPEPGKWDLPGGGIKPGEKILETIEREVLEETGLTKNQYQVNNLLTIVESFFPDWGENGLHSISIIYKCNSKNEPPVNPVEINGVVRAEWKSISDLKHNIECTERSLLAMQKDNFIYK